MKMHCIIIDDEPVARRLLEEYIEDIDFLDLVGKAENPLKAHSLLDAGAVDLMFLDINMPRMNGIEFLRTSTTLPPAILTTAYTEYAIQGFELQVLDYLVKPFSFERFYKGCCRARDYFDWQRHSAAAVSGNPARDGADGLSSDSSEALPKTTSPASVQSAGPLSADNAGNPADFFFVKCDGRIEKVYYEELLYIEAMLNYVVLHTDARRLIVYLTIKGIVEQLPQGKFIKIHKSTIVNVDRIKTIEGNRISVGQTVLVISQALQESVVKEILKDRMLKR